MESGRGISQERKSISFDLVVTKVGEPTDGKINERVSTEFKVDGDVRAIDMLTCNAVIAMNLIDILGEDEYYSALEQRITEMKKEG